MKNKLLKNIFLVSVQLLVLCLMTNAQSVGIGFKSGIRIATRTEAVFNNEKVNIRPSDKSETKNGIDIIHRKLIDLKNGTFIAYDIEVMRGAEADKFNVTLKTGFREAENSSKNAAPKTEAEQKLEAEAREIVRRAQAEKDPRLQELDLLAAEKAREKSLFNKPLVVSNGDIIKLELYENSYKKQKITDYIKIYDDTKSFAIAFSELQQSKDFTLDDVNLKLANFEIFINGKPIGKMGGGASGSNIYFTVPNRGRIIVSPFSREGYNLQKIGNIVDNKLTFTIGADKYEIVSKSSILGDGGNWNAWILHDPQYQKKYNDPEYADSIEVGAGNLKFFFEKRESSSVKK